MDGTTRKPGGEQPPGLRIITTSQPAKAINAVDSDVAASPDLCKPCAPGVENTIAEVLDIEAENRRLRAAIASGEDKLRLIRRIMRKTSPPLETRHKLVRADGGAS